MDLNPEKMTIEMTFDEIICIINCREKAAIMETVMDNGKVNPLNVQYNEGVKMMAKYMRDYFTYHVGILQDMAEKEGEQ